MGLNNSSIKIKAEAFISSPLASSVSSLPTRESAILVENRKLKVVLPTRQTFQRKIKTSIEFNGYNHIAHFQHLIYEDSKLPSSSKIYRWNFGFRFCGYFVHSNRKIFTKTLVNGTNHKITVASFPGLKDYLLEKNIDANVLQKPLPSDTILFFVDHENQRSITKFLHALCSFLYSFLPEHKRKYKAKGDVINFCLSNNTSAANNNTDDYVPCVIKQEDSSLWLNELKLEPDDE